MAMVTVAWGVALVVLHKSVDSNRCNPEGQRCEAFLKRRHSAFSMVAEVVRLLGYTRNARILTNPATEMLHSVARGGNAVKHFLGSYRRQTVVNREGGYLRPRSGERSYDVFAVKCSMNILNGVTPSVNLWTRP